MQPVHTVVAEFVPDPTAAPPPQHFCNIAVVLGICAGSRVDIFELNAEIIAATGLPVYLLQPASRGKAMGQLLPVVRPGGRMEVFVFEKANAVVTHGRMPGIKLDVILLFDCVLYSQYAVGVVVMVGFFNGVRAGRNLLADHLLFQATVVAKAAGSIFYCI